jgi:(S)-2-hydroxyglutarate dehydrogenase
MTDATADVLIIGGGIVGLATAYQLGRLHPGRSVVLVEKEPELAAHQTGHNSGVLHSGVYYKPGSLKASLCRSGKKEMEELCEREPIPYERCGKVIVAADDEEVPRLAALLDRARANGVVCNWIDAARLREIEPHVRGVKAIHVPETAITNYRLVAGHLAKHVEAAGGVVVTGAAVTALREAEEDVVVETTAGAFTARIAVNCGGLQSDRLAALAGQTPSARIVPFRGEYYYLTPSARRLCRNLIYPTPDPRFPFLGVHFTRLISGEVKAGPNAVLALAREGYTRGAFALRDLGEVLAYRGFRKLAARHWRTGAEEIWRSFSKTAFTKALQRLIPEIVESDLDGETSGVRAQAVAADGTLLDDFCFSGSRRVLNVVNAPSPAATASLAIGRHIVREVETRFER